MNYRPWMVVSAGAFMLVGLAGCGKHFIKVNGEKVSREDFSSRLEKVNVNTNGGLRAAGDVMAERIISDMLVLQFAKTKNASPTKEQVDAKYDYFVKQSGGNVAAILSRSGLTQEDLRRQLEVEQAKFNLIAADIQVPEEKVRQAYAEVLAMKNTPLRQPERRTISMIANSSKATIDKAYSMLKSGMEFSAAAEQMSDVPNLKTNRGQMGLIARDTAAVPESARQLAFSTRVAQYTKPFRFGTKWAILRVDQVLPKRVTSFDEAKAALRERIALQTGAAKHGKQLGEEWRAFVSKSDVAINSERYKTLLDSIKQQAGQGMMGAPTK